MLTQKTTSLARVFALSTLMVAPLVGCTIREEPDYQNVLDENLRVLAIRSVPAEVPLGESTTLSALVHQPADGSCSGEPRYEWSWCPLRGDAEAGFECLMPEEEVQLMWTALGVDGELPPYDLGAGAEMEYLNLLGDLAEFICADSVEGNDETAELERYNCEQTFQVSVRVDVSYCGQTQSAVSELSLMGQEETEDADYVPNTNPSPAGVLTFSPAGDPETDLTGDDPLETGLVYNMSLDLDEGDACDEDDAPGECVAELFTPDIPGIDEDERRERLVMAWYVSKGNTSPDFLDGEEYQPDTDSQGGQNTYFFETDEDIRVILGNVLSLEREKSGSGELIVVLRDERGGVDWARFPFTVEDAQ